MFQNAWLSYLIISDNNISFLKSVSNCDLELSNRCGVFSVKLKEIVFVIVVRESNFEIALLRDNTFCVNFVKFEDGYEYAYSMLFLFYCSFAAFSCFRKKRDSYYKEKFILANDKVDDHLANVYKNANQSVSDYVLLYFGRVSSVDF